MAAPLIAGALVVASAVAPSPARAAATTVNSLADLAADDGACTLREAIGIAPFASSGVTPGECVSDALDRIITFSVAGTITLSSPLPTVSQTVTIDGGSVITVSGGGAHRVFDVSLGTVTLSGLTITGGAATGDGGGIRILAGVVTVRNSVISGNSATGAGGGISASSHFELTVANSTVTGNSAGGFGGGIQTMGPLTVTGSTISGNSAAGDGGGIHVSPGLRGDNYTVANSTIAGNSAVIGAGIHNIQGGGILDRDGTLTVLNSTITGNTATASGGGIAARGLDFVVNSIVAGNAAPAAPEVESALEGTTTSLVGVPAGKALADILEPAGLAANGGPTRTIALTLAAGNPAIDTATSANCASAPISGVDQRGLPRPTACDIGAYEAQPPSIASHADVSAAPTSADGAVVSYVPPVATDDRGAVLAVTCLPASGSTFGLGATTVSCSATDAVGHTSTRSFTVNVSASPAPVITLPNTATGEATLDPASLAAVAIVLILARPAWHASRVRIPSRRGTVTAWTDRRRG